MSRSRLLTPPLPFLFFFFLPSFHFNFPTFTPESSDCETAPYCYRPVRSKLVPYFLHLVKIITRPACILPPCQQIVDMYSAHGAQLDTQGRGSFPKLTSDGQGRPHDQRRSLTWAKPNPESDDINTSRDSSGQTSETLKIKAVNGKNKIKIIKKKRKREKRSKP